MLQPLPVGIQTFEEIRDRDYLYIDKTEAIHRLIVSGKYYFLVFTGGMGTRRTGVRVRP